MSSPLVGRRLILVNYRRPCDWAILMKFRGWACGVGLTRLLSVTYRNAQATLMGWLADTQNWVFGGGWVAEIGQQETVNLSHIVLSRGGCYGEDLKVKILTSILIIFLKQTLPARSKPKTLFLFMTFKKNRTNILISTKHNFKRQWEQKKKLF